MSSNRIILNTVATYIRSVIAAGLALFSSRWVLTALGSTDYGIFAVVGSIIVFITFLNGVMAGSASRHFAFAIGRGDCEEVNKWFNAALSIHLIMPLVLISIGWPIGEYCIRHVFAIPIDRILASLWVFRMSLILAFVGMVSVPYMAMYTAKQRIAELAAFGTLQSVLMFAFAYILTKKEGDRLLFYAGYGVVITGLVQIMQILRARYIFRECCINYHQWFDLIRFKEILSFASWNLIGSFGSIIRDQGSSILLNLHFGPKINASFGIATQVCAQTSQLGVAMINAFAPEIIASEGRGDRKRMISLAQQGSKFGTIFVLLFATPLIVEMDYILKLWLVEPPLHTTLFCQLILTAFVLDRLSIGYSVAVSACGTIAGYQASLGTCLVLTVPLSWILLKLGAPPTCVGVAFVVTMTIVSVGRVFWARRLLDVPISGWLCGVAAPVGIVILASLSAALGSRCLFSASFIRLVLVSLTSGAASLVAIWVTFDDRERAFIKQIIRRLLDRRGDRLHV